MAIKIRHRIQKDDLPSFSLSIGSSHIKSVAEQFATLQKIVPSRTRYNNGVAQQYIVHYAYEATGDDVGKVVTITVQASAGSQDTITVQGVPEEITLAKTGSGNIQVLIAHDVAPDPGKTVFFGLDLHFGNTIHTNYANYYAD